jgi:hypothetical protein
MHGEGERGETCNFVGFFFFFFFFSISRKGGVWETSRMVIIIRSDIVPFPW